MATAPRHRSTGSEYTTRVSPKAPENPQRQASHTSSSPRSPPGICPWSESRSSLHTEWIRLRPIVRIRIGLHRARRRAPVDPNLVHLPSHRSNHLGFSGHPICPLRHIATQVIQLKFRQSGRLLASRFWIAPPAAIRSEEQLPRSLAQSKETAIRMMHQGLATCPRPIPSTQLGQKTHTILGRTRRQALPQNIGQGRPYIQLAHQTRTRRSGRHLSGPSDQERHPMTSLEQVGLVTAETGTRIMPKSPQLAQIGRRRTAIVRRENHQCIPRNPERIQRTENVAHRRIHLHHEIPVRVGSRPPSEFRSGNGRCVGRRQSQVEEKRRTVHRPGACPRLDPRQRLLPKPRMHRLMPEIRPDHPARHIFGPGLAATLSRGTVVDRS